MSTDDSALGGTTEPQVLQSEEFGNTSQQAMQEQQTDSNGNPAWKPFLDVVPTAFHKQVEPVLREWDTNFTNKLNQVQSQYAPFKPFLDQQVQPEQLQQGLQLMKMIQENPRVFYDRMTQHYGNEWGLNSGQGTDEDDDAFDLDDQEQNYGQLSPQQQQELEQLRNQQTTIAAYLAQDLEAKEMAKHEAQVDTEFNQVKEKYGDLTPDHVDAIVSMAIQSGSTVVEAADKLFKFTPAPNQQAQRTVPRVVAPNGGVPTAPPVKPKTRNERVALVARVLAENAAHNEGN